jgi:hypothetical protein
MWGVLRWILDVKLSTDETRTDGEAGARFDGHVVNVEPASEMNRS